MAKIHKQLIHLEAVGLIKLVQTHPELEYLFRHALVQEVAYNSLLIEDRKKLHRKTGQVIEETYPNRLDELAATVAHHFTLAEDVEKAIHYLYRAGGYATKISAHNEAIEHFTKALVLLESLSDSSQYAERELKLQIVLGQTLIVIKGSGAPEVEYAFSRAYELCQQAGDSSQLFEVLWGLCTIHAIRGEISGKARTLAEQLLEVAQELQDPTRLIGTYILLGTISFWAGELTSGQALFEKGLALYDPQQSAHLSSRYGFDPATLFQRSLALIKWLLGYPERSLEHIRAGLNLAQELAHPFSIAGVLAQASILYHFRREEQACREWAEEAITLSTKHGFAAWKQHATMNRGWALTELGQEEEGIEQIRQGLDALHSTGARAGAEGLHTSQLAKAYLKIGHVTEALMVVEKTLIEIEKIGERYMEVEMYRLKGELLEMQGASEEEVEQQFHRAIDIARRQQAKSWELRATVSLCRLWQRQGKTEEAREMLAEIYNWFTEGFDTVDLKEAKTLLEELS